MSEACASYQPAAFTCRDGFMQRPACHGSIGCMTCGSVKAAYLPYCLQDELPAHWINEDGSPRFHKAPQS